jgi:hypothetical protein
LFAVRRRTWRRGGPDSQGVREDECVRSKHGGIARSSEVHHNLRDWVVRVQAPRPAMRFTEQASPARPVPCKLIALPRMALLGVARAVSFGATV